MWPVLHPVHEKNDMKISEKMEYELNTVSFQRESIEQAINKYKHMVTSNPFDYASYIELAHLHLLLGDAFLETRSEKHASFIDAMRFAESAMFLNPRFREKIENGATTWEACKYLSEKEVDAMFFWVNSVFYIFKEAQWAPWQIINFRWMLRARMVIECLDEIAPEDYYPLVDFLWGIYYLAVPERFGGNNLLSEKYFQSAVESAPNLLLPRWGRARFFHVKMNNPIEFKADLDWILSQEEKTVHDHPAWKMFIIRDAQRLLKDMDVIFILKTDTYQRSARKHVPQSYTPQEPFPLVIVLHGAFSSGKQMEQFSKWSSLAEQENFIVVYPEGIGLFGFLQHWNAGHCCGRAADKQWDDIHFIESLINVMTATYSIDTSKIYMVGHSNGGMMTYRFATERPELISKTAVFAGTVWSETGKNGDMSVPPAKGPVPMLIMHGTDDDVIPFHGGYSKRGGDKRFYASVDQSFQFWVEQNRCIPDSPAQEQILGRLRVRSCFDNSQEAIRLIILDGWGHGWPGGAATRSLPEDHPLRDFDAASHIWDFFQQQAIPGGD
jgi:polyhydroxybutyrate depolymerase